ncbi:MAG: TIGR01777 family oxidoreductase [Bacteroidales bacterium]|nr:TIGR01777 family oxidoreductase [Bacteroidales bacterium]
MKILVAGGTGFIGTALCKYLKEQNYEIILITRKKSKAFKYLDYGVKTIEWKQFDSDDLSISLNNLKCVINLSGESLSGSRWTEKYKERIFMSRINTTAKLVDAIRSGKINPEIFINASAIGYYDEKRDIELTEDGFYGSNFLSRVCKYWEIEAFKAETLGVRVITLRAGIVLGKGGFLSNILLPFRFFMGGYIGNGKQWFSWIHISDYISIVNYIINNNKIIGPVNLTAPNPVTMKVFCKALAKASMSLCWLRIPSFLIKFVFKEKSLIFLSNHKVIPDKLIKAGYQFQFPTIEIALRNLVKI